METSISINLFVCSLAIYFLGFIIFYGKQLYGIVTNRNSDKSRYIRKMLYGIPIFTVVAIAIVALLFIGSIIEFGGINGLTEYCSR